LIIKNTRSLTAEDGIFSVEKNVLEIGIQVKIRRPKWWHKAGEDFPIEEYDGCRPGGKGWFQLYRKQGIGWMAFIWRSCELRDTYQDCPKLFDEKGRFKWRGDPCVGCPIKRTGCQLYLYSNAGDSFFDRIELLKKENEYKRYEVNERCRDGKIGKVGGIILPLYYIENLLVYDTTTRMANESPVEWEGNIQ